MKKEQLRTTRFVTRSENRSGRNLCVLFGTHLSALLILLVASVGVQAQYEPSAPISPKSAEECKVFSDAMSSFLSAMNQKHEECVNAAVKNGAKASPETGAWGCSQPACQHYHDFSLWGVRRKEENQKVTTCYDEFKEYADRQAEEKRQTQLRQQKKDKEQSDTIDKMKQEQALADKKQQSEAAESSVKKEKAAAEKSAELKAKRDNAQAEELERKQQASAALYAEELQRLAAQDEAQRKAIAKQIAKHRELNASEAAMGTSQDQKVDRASSADISSLENGPSPFASTNGANHSSLRKMESKDSDEARELETAKSVAEQAIDHADEQLNKLLQDAQSTLSASDFDRYKQQVENARSFFNGLSAVIKSAKYTKDLQLGMSGEPNGWSNFVSDFGKDGFSYVLKRLAPHWAEIYEGPAGWVASTTFDSSSTQTPQQDLDPMTALNNPSQYSFQEREAALESLYQSADKHPEVWNDARRRWLLFVTDSLYNSPENPNIRLLPQ